MTGTTEPNRQLDAIIHLHETTQKQYLDILCAQASDDLSSFVEYMTPDEPPAEHHEFFCDKLMALERRDILRATFSCPPGHAKTKFCSRYFVAWYLGRNRNHRYLQGGHSQKFAEDEFGKVTRDIIADPRFQNVFPEVKLNPKSTAAGAWRLANSRGAYVTKGVGQSIAGYRGHIGGIDDPFGSREDANSEVIRTTARNWLFTDFRTRLLPRSPLFIIATRWHPDDLIGAVEEMSRKGIGMPWEIYALPAIIETEEEMSADPLGRSMGEPLWGDFFTIEELLELKATLPSGDWNALYQCRPRDPEGNVVKGSWFQRYDRLPNNLGEQEIKRITLSLDVAEKATERANYSVATIWIEDFHGKHYLADVWREKVEFNDLITKVEDLARRWQVNSIIVEDAGAGIQYIQQRTGKAPAPIIPIPTNNKSKEFRFDGVLPMFEGKEVWLPKKARWVKAYEEELLSFPNGSNDDQVDSTSQYLAWARKRGKYGTRKLKGAGNKR